MNWEEVERHYYRPDVGREIYEYCYNRWVAIHCESTGERGLQIMIRYEGGTRRPLKITTERDIKRLMEKYAELRPRAFYATIHTYSKILRPADPLDRENISHSSPT